MEKLPILARLISIACLAILPWAAAAQHTLPSIHKNMTPAELEAIVAYIHETGSDPISFEKILIDKYEGGTREEGLQALNKCREEGYSFCHAKGHTYKAGTDEVFCHLWEKENALARDILSQFPWPTACYHTIEEKLPAVSEYVNQLKKLNGGSLSSSCGTIQRIKWARIQALKQEMSFYPTEPHNNASHQPILPKNSFGLAHWSQQGLWEQEQYKLLNQLKENAVQALASYYETNQLLEVNYSESAREYLNQLESSFLGYAGVTAAGVYETSYWGIKDLEHYLQTGEIDRKENAYYAQHIDASDAAILSRYLYLAVVNGYDIDVIKRLIQEGAPLQLAHQYANGPSSYQETPLMQAVNRTEIVKILLSHDSDVNAQNKFGKTALMYAIQAQNPEVVSLLLNAKADPNLVTLKLENVLTVTCAGYALEAGGRSPLMYAAWHATPEIVKMLLEAGADTTLKDSNGKSACAYIAKNDGLNAHEKQGLKKLLICSNST